MSGCTLKVTLQKHVFFFFFFSIHFSAVASKPRLQVETSRVSSTMAAVAVVNVQLLSPVEAVQVLQDEVVAESILVLRRKTAAFCPLNGPCCYFPGERSTHQRLHHVGLTVAESFNSVKDVHHVLVLNHLQQNVAGAEGPTAAATVPAGRTNKRRDVA